jgi:type I restriction enzyme S subunit
MSEQIPFSSLVKINPPLDCTLPSPRAEVSFISMQDVTNSGDWSHRQSRQLLSIGNGYTPFQEDDVLFAKITPCMENGKGAHAAGLVNGVGFGSTEFHVLRAIKDISPRFVFHICNSREFRQAAEIQMIGSAGQKRVPAEFFARFFVPRFSSAEQHAIATILDSMDEAIRQTEAVLAKLRQVKAGMLHDLLTRGLDENGELRDPLRHPEQFKDYQAVNIPKEWNICGIDELVINHDGQRVPIKQADRDKMKGGYPYYGASGIIDYVNSFIFDGDFVLLGEDGENIVSRNLPLAFQVKGKIWVNNHAHVFEAKPGIDRDFLEILLESTDYSPIILGSAQPKISQSGLRKLRFLLPKYHEQIRISKKINEIQAVINNENSYLAKMILAKQGLLHDLLTGHVRVPSHLLEAMS